MLLSTEAAALGLATLDARYVEVAGDTMTGALVVDLNSATALTVEQDGVNDDVFVVDTANNRVGVGRAPTAANIFQVYHASADVDIRCETDKADGAVGFRLINDAIQWRVFCTTGDDFQVKDITNTVIAISAAEATGRVGIGTGGPSAQLHVDQFSSTGAVPALLLDQADIDLEFIKFIGSSEDGEADRSLVDVADMTTPGALVGWIQIYVEDIQGTNPIADGVYYQPFYAAPSA